MVVGSNVMLSCMKLASCAADISTCGVAKTHVCVLFLLGNVMCNDIHHPPELV